MLDLKSLYSVLVREIESDSLQYIDPATYRDASSMLASLKGQGYDGIEAKVKGALVDLIVEITTSLLNTRIEKIRSAADYSNLTEEEQYIVRAEKDRSRRFEEVLSSTLEGRVKVLEGISLKAKTAHVMVRFLAPSEAISGVDSQRYGPFEEEDVAVLPFENAKQLIAKGLAIQLPALD